MLPKFRGAAPINHALIAGESTTGVTIQSMAARIDAGAIAAQREINIAPDWNAGDLTDALADLGAQLLVDVLDRLEAGTLRLEEQPRQGITRAPRLTKSDGIIDWAKPARDIHNLVRGVTPWPGAQTTHLDQNAKALKLLVTATALKDAETQAGSPGELIALSDEGIEVACGQGVLRILKLKAAGKREMPAGDFLRGQHWQTGDRLVSSS